MGSLRRANHIHFIRRWNWKSRIFLAVVRRLNFSSNYIESAQIILAEDFESANRFEANNTSTAEVVRTVDPDLVFEGNASGLILLSPEQYQVTSTTQEQLYNLPQSGPDLFGV